MALGDEEPPAEGLEAGDDAFVPMEGIEADPGACDLTFAPPEGWADVEVAFRLFF